MSFRFRLFLLAAALAPVCAPLVPVARAQAVAERPKKEISEAASVGFAKLQPLVESKKHADALALVGQLLAAVPPTSYDAYVLLQIKAQILLNQEKLAEAIAPLERARALAEGNRNFFESTAHLERLYLLAQLYYQRAAETTGEVVRSVPGHPERAVVKVTGSAPPAERQREDYEKALACLGRWFALSPKPSADARLCAASLLYNLATLDSAKPDAARLREAAAEAREALVLSAGPNRQARLLLVACLLQLGENALAAEQLEVLSVSEPQNASTWSQLHALYLTAAAEARDPAEARAAGLRALLALERAQSLGFLVYPKDNYTRVAVLFNLRRFARAAALLEAGLADGAIEGSRRNWELLASAYQQSDREEAALDALGRAVEKFPADAGFEFSLAQALHNAGRAAEAYARGQSALAKPGLEKPGQARLYLAFLAYELRRYDEAARWLAEARSDGGVPADSLDPLARAVKEAIAQREALDKS